MSAEAWIDIVEKQYVVRVQIGDTSVHVYLDDETGVVETPSGGYGIEVGGPWFEFRKSKTEIKQLRELLAEAKDDIREEVENRYPFKDDYPEEMRRYNRDMEIVHRINAALVEDS